MDLGADPDVRDGMPSSRASLQAGFSIADSSILH